MYSIVLGYFCSYSNNTDRLEIFLDIKDLVPMCFNKLKIKRKRLPYAPTRIESKLI